MSEINSYNKNYIGYEYKELVVESSLVSIYIDGYESFGWVIDNNQPEIKESGKVVIRLKRNRTIMNKVELTRLQRHFDDCMKQINTLESSKTSTATIVSFITGIIGTAFMAGSVFAVVHEPPLILLTIILAIPAFIGWILPYFLYKKIVRNKIEILTPLIEEKQDELDRICEKGYNLLR